MLAVNADISKITYPVLASPKFDGIRCVVKDGRCMTRNLKDLPNVATRNKILSLFQDIPGVIDGEIIAGSTFNETSSKIMSFNGEPDFQYHIFDYVSNDNYTMGYADRILSLYSDLSKYFEYMFIKPVFPVPIHDYEELYAYEETCLSQGYEGCIIRSPKSLYKFGRSTVKEGYLLKIKRFTDAEAEVIGMDELMTNMNDLGVDEKGYAKRSSCKDGLVGGNTLGSLKVKDCESGVEFAIGTGFDADLREQIWNNKQDYIGQLVKYKSQKSGEKDLPRFPVFLGFRSKDDL